MKHDPHIIAAKIIEPLIEGFNEALCWYWIIISFPFRAVAFVYRVVKIKVFGTNK